MKPELFIFKKKARVGNRAFTYFSVVDSEINHKYPANFVCTLPVINSNAALYRSDFVRIFGSNCLEVAKQLLLDALVRENDLAFKKEISERLSFLEKTIDLLPLLHALVESKMISAHSININEAKKLILTGNCSSCNFDSVKNYLEEKGFSVEHFQQEQYCIIQKSGVC